jgi:hypothetical protein
MRLQECFRCEEEVNQYPDDVCKPCREAIAKISRDQWKPSKDAADAAKGTSNAGVFKRHEVDEVAFLRDEAREIERDSWTSMRRIHSFL